MITIFKNLGQKTLLLIIGGSVCLAVYSARATVTKIEEDKRQEATQQALDNLEKYFDFSNQKESAKESHYIYRSLIEENCKKVDQPLEKCKYLPKDLYDKFKRFDKYFEPDLVSINYVANKLEFNHKNVLDKSEQITKESIETPFNIGNKCGSVIKKGWSKEASYWVQRAYEISNCNKEFVLMLEAENGMWDQKRQSNCSKNGVRETSYGFCQLNSIWHKEILNLLDKPEEQLKLCWEKYKSGVEFYGKNRIDKIKNNIIFE